MSRQFSDKFFTIPVTIYPESGVIWRKGRMIKGYSWTEVRTAAMAAGCDVQNVAGGFEIRISPKPAAVVESEAAPEPVSCPADSMSKPERALFINGVNIIARFQDEDTAREVQYTMDLYGVFDWVDRLVELGEAAKSTLAVARAWLDKAQRFLNPPEPEMPSAPSRIKFGCEHCGFMGVCDCRDELDDMFELQMLFDDESFDEYLVAEDNGPCVDEYLLVATTATFIAINPRDGSAAVDGKSSWACDIKKLVATLKVDGWESMATNGYGVNRWFHPTRRPTEAALQARSDGYAVGVEVTRQEEFEATEPHKMVVILTPSGMFDFRDPDKPHARTYPKGWHIGRAYSWMVSRAWHVVEEDKYRGVIRHLTLSKLTHA